MKCCGAVIVALAIAMTACKKSSSGNSLGTGSMTVNGQSTTFAAVYDTTTIFTIVAAGVLPATKDTAEITFTLSYNNVYSNIAPWNYQYSGLWADTATEQVLNVFLVDAKTGYQYRDASTTTQYPSVLHPDVMTITSNKGNVISGTFSGELFDLNANDSLLIQNGSFSAKLQ